MSRAASGSAGTDRSAPAPVRPVAGFRCAVCAATVDIATPYPWRCPNASSADRYHVLHIVEGADDGVGGGSREAGNRPPDDHPNPFLRYGPRLAWWAFARANGLSEATCAALTERVAGDFRATPFTRSASLGDELGVELWVKDETANVSGSHKARHLVSILLHLLAVEALDAARSPRSSPAPERPPLAIASCGNAALAAATLAGRVGWPIDVYVPAWADDGIRTELERLGARVEICARRAGDPPGDPAMLRFREARAAGAIPFTVQGPENALCLDGGRTLGWEIADATGAAGFALDRVVIQVGGGALAACLGVALGGGVRLDTVQSEGCAPLAAAWGRLADVERPGRHWAELMQPWPDPRSVADGILDDETYDWLGDVAVMVASGGRPVVASEAQIVRAHRLAVAAGHHASPTGAAGLAGVLALRDELAPGERVAIVMSGVDRRAAAA